MDVMAAILFLMPDAVFDLVGFDYSGIVWRDPRPQPSLAQVQAAWVQVQAQRAAAAQAAATAATNDATIRQQALGLMDYLRTVRDGASIGTGTQATFNKQVARVLLLLLRLALGKLDGTA